MSEEKTEQLILVVEKTVLFDKFRHDYRKEKRCMNSGAKLSKKLVGNRI